LNTHLSDRSASIDAMDSTTPDNSPAGQTPARLAEVRGLILEACGPALADFGITAADAPGDLDLRGSGMIDSLGFVEVIVELEEKLEIEIDLEDLDPEQITVLDPLATYVAGLLERRSGSGR
jgi:acyl carrier protein